MVRDGAKRLLTIATEKERPPQWRPIDSIQLDYRRSAVTIDDNRLSVVNSASAHRCFHDECAGKNERGIYALMANQIAAMAIAATITAHTAGVTCFELPLRGESLAG